MANIRHKSLEDICPIYNETIEIDVHYTMFYIRGSLSLHGKRMGFDCPNMDDCEQSNNCPLYESAPITITE